MKRGENPHHAYPMLKFWIRANTLMPFDRTPIPKGSVSFFQGWQPVSAMVAHPAPTPVHACVRRNFLLKIFRTRNFAYRTLGAPWQCGGSSLRGGVATER